LFPQENAVAKDDFYLAARPNPGAGIGHQMANWIAGYWWAKQFGIRFAHIPFSSKIWEDFLGFGSEEKTVNELKAQGYKRVLLPLFNEEVAVETKRVQKIIDSYSGKKIVFVCEQDQFYRDQYGVMDNIKQKFYNAPARKTDKLKYSNEHFNIAIHVRRGDIMADPTNPNLQMRYIANYYFEKVLDQVLLRFPSEKPTHIYFFSQGKPADFPDFQKYNNLHWCFDIDARDSFLHMVYADLLITSKSSFSYKPALLNKGIKVCPQDFWHGYPDTENWILADENGNFEYKAKDIVL
jgi:hypothetical protein